MKKKIFICDDDLGIVDMLELILEFTDADTISEGNSIHAFDRLLETKPNMLIVDLWMPVVSGDQLIRRIRSTDALRDLYIICISASRDGEKIAQEAGADLFLAKPFDMDDIIRAVEGALV
ncbi:response regulator [Sphingobacterium suaedae]|uniref:PleD family two-component system response regulator n=1 Tax=Sphingobacterium suaedae TaxID=1686402 RepID=A0ABW5KFV2_9SPHI